MHWEALPEVNVWTLASEVCLRGRPLIIWGGAWCKTKKKISFGGSPKKKKSVKGASEKKKLRLVNLNVKKKFFLRFSCETMLLKKKNSSVNFGKKIKIWFGGSPKKKNLVRRVAEKKKIRSRKSAPRPPQMINGRPLRVGLTHLCAVACRCYGVYLIRRSNVLSN